MIRRRRGERSGGLPGEGCGTRTPPYSLGHEIFNLLKWRLATPPLNFKVPAPHALTVDVDEDGEVTIVTV